MDTSDLIKSNTARWQSMITRTDLVPAIDRTCRRIWTHSTKFRYQMISKNTGIPTGFIVLTHLRESDCDWTRSLAQGDKLTARSTHQPAGRIPPPAQPPFSFEDAAHDALVTVDGVNEWIDWSIGGLLTRLEMYNGTGYARRGLASPYLWASTNQYHSGKYVADGMFDPDVVDQQFGVAAVLARLTLLDADVQTWPREDVEADHSAMTPLPPRDDDPGRDVAWVQRALNAAATSDPQARSDISDALRVVGGQLPLAVDGDYGRRTRAAVRGYQQFADLLEDGKAGDKTQRSLERYMEGSR